MGGLLYKEYVSFGGKRIVKIYLLATVVFVLLRVILRGDFGGENMVTELDGGANCFFMGPFLYDGSDVYHNVWSFSGIWLYWIACGR